MTEEDINKENMSQGARDECLEEQILHEYDEEPVLIASTEYDDVYIIFENSITDTQRKPFISHNLATPEASSTITIASGTSYISQGNANILCQKFIVNMYYYVYLLT